MTDLNWFLENPLPKSLKVRVKKPIFEDVFVEPGMVCYLTNIQKVPQVGCWEIFFDYTDFFDENEHLFTKTFFMPDTSLGTAMDAGAYDPVHSLYFGDLNPEFDDDLNEYLEVVHEIRDYTITTVGSIQFTIKASKVVSDNENVVAYDSNGDIFFTIASILVEDIQ